MTTTAPNVQRTTGILNRTEAAEILGTVPIAVSRLIAWNQLAYNRAADGTPLILEADLQRYVGAGTRNLAMPGVQGGWLGGDLSSNDSFVKKFRQFVADVEVTDDHVREMYENQKKSSYLTAGIRITPAMREAYNAGATTLSSGKVRPSGDWSAVDPEKFPLAKLSAGQRFFAGVLRRHARRFVDRKQNGAFDPSPIEKLYSSPDAFRAALEYAAKAARSESVFLTEWRTLPEFPHKKFSIRKEISLAAIPADFENEMALVASKCF
ncbi:hypothetical protein [Rosistilla oblonga]|uniref:Uncharacterized protein n=1 Tax=Rosistilla oblonga TaxID=2527990 RepID=A0A518IQY5_9BACT|nr:hypothetical protein [Rosistilla oblonga]QDV55480.1 hypothetical protein Mal33_14550 [Rosistilla oblonga]